MAGLLDEGLQGRILGQLYVGSFSEGHTNRVDLASWIREQKIDFPKFEVNFRYLVELGLAEYACGADSGRILSGGVVLVEEQGLAPDPEIQRRQSVRKSILQVLVESFERGEYCVHYPQILGLVRVTNNDFSRETLFLGAQGFLDDDAPDSGFRISLATLATMTQRPPRWDDPLQLRRAIEELGKLDPGRGLIPAEISRLTGIPEPRISTWCSDGKLERTGGPGAYTICVAQVIRLLQNKLEGKPLKGDEKPGRPRLRTDRSGT